MISTRGSALRLWYHCGCFGPPPTEATAAYTPSCSTRMSGTLRTAPDFAPRMVSRTTGRFWMWTDRVSPVSSIRSTCRRTHPVGLGRYAVAGSGIRAPLPQVDAGVHGVLVDGRELLVGEVQVVDRAEGVVELGDARGTDEDRGHPAVAQRPGQRHLRQRLSAGA